MGTAATQQQQQQPIVTWQPQPKQAVALACPADELFYGGAKGGGKSDYLLADYLSGVHYGAPHRGILFRRTTDELEELQRRAVEIYVPLGAEYAAQKRTWTFRTGATLKMRYLDRDDDVHRYQGHAYSWIGHDELTNWPTDYCYVYMLSCARSAEGIPVHIRASGNPGSAGHVWVKERFVNIGRPMELYYDPVTRLSRVFIPARLEDNQILDRNDPAYRQRLEALPEHLRRAYIDGDWDIFAGQVFEEFRRDVHVVEPVAIDPSWYRFASMDWGYNKPFSVGWWAVTPDGRMIRYREWYGCEQGKHDVGIRMSASEVASRAWDMSIAEGCKDMVADPACWSKIDDHPSIADHFAIAGWSMIKGVNDRVNGLARVHDRLKVTGHDGRPMMLIFDTCRDFIRTIPVLTVDPRKPEDLDTTGEDHIYDEMRYAVMSNLSKTVVRPERVDVYSEAPQVQAYDPLHRN